MDIFRIKEKYSLAIDINPMEGLITDFLIFKPLVNLGVKALYVQAIGRKRNP